MFACLRCDIHTQGQEVKENGKAKGSEQLHVVHHSFIDPEGGSIKSMLHSFIDVKAECLGVNAASL